VTFQLDPTLNSQDLERQLLIALNAQARKDFATYVQMMQPDYQMGRHHKLICQKLQDVAEGRIKRLMIFAPPRTGKSQLVSRHFPAWFYGNHPRSQLIQISHSTGYAEDIGADVRDAMQTSEFHDIFPKVYVNQDAKARGRFQTTLGGVYIARGAGAKIAGRGAHIAIIDDPISEQEAFSKARKAELQRWWPAGLRTRLMPNGAIIIINTRWAEDDLSGWLLHEAAVNPGADQWEVLELPAILEEGYEDIADRLGLPIGSALWPEWWPLEEMERTRDNLPTYQWESVYMQRPIADGGNILKEAWWQEWQDETAPACHTKIQVWDTAFSEKERADYSACTTWGLWDNPAGVTQIILLKAEKARMDFPTLKARAIELYYREHPALIIVEDKASGQSLIQDLRRTGLPVRAFQPGKTDKEARAHSVTPIMSAGLVWFNPNIESHIEVCLECCGFPNLPHDDYVDTVIMALKYLQDTASIVKPEDWSVDRDWETQGRRPPKSRRRFYAGR